MHGCSLFQIVLYTPPHPPPPLTLTLSLSTMSDSPPGLNRFCGGPVELLITARPSRAVGNNYCAASKDTLLRGALLDQCCRAIGGFSGTSAVCTWPVCVRVCVCAHAFLRLDSLICTFAVCKICSVTCGVMCDLVVLERVTGRFAEICQFIFIRLLAGVLLSAAAC